MSSESIYAWIPRPPEVVVKPPMYRSKHNPVVPPTGTTFGLLGSTRLPGTNLGGETEAVREVMKQQPGKLFGTATKRMTPGEFTRKGERCATGNGMKGGQGESSCNFLGQPRSYSPLRKRLSTRRLLWFTVVSFCLFYYHVSATGSSQAEAQGTDSLACRASCDGCEGREELRRCKCGGCHHGR